MTALLVSFTFADAIGVAGAALVVVAYFLTQMRVLNSDDLVFPVVNLIGAAMILYSLIFAFNLASVLIEGFWIVISLIGIWQHLRRRR